MFAYSPQPVQPVVPQPAMVDTRAFGLVLPGYPVVFDQAFQRVAPDRWILPIEFAQSLRDVTLFLNSPLPDQSVSLSIFFALPPFSDFRFIGSVNNASPSTSVRLRLQPGDGQPTALQIAVLMEATGASEQRSAQLQGNEFSQFGRCVAMDLMRFCQSFQIMAQGGGDVLSQLLTKWSLRFEEKCARDPYWWLKAAAE